MLPPGLGQTDRVHEPEPHKSQPTLLAVGGNELGDLVFSYAQTLLSTPPGNAVGQAVLDQSRAQDQPDP